MSSPVIEKLKKQLAEWTPQTETDAIGRVLSCGDGIAEIEGLGTAQMSEMVIFETGKEKSIEASLKEKGEVLGVILNIEEDALKGSVLGESSTIGEETTVRGTGRILSLPVGNDLLGRVINPRGEPLDGGAPIKPDATYPIEKRAPGVIERKSVSTPLHTGIKTIDAMIPIGRGQRELIIGDRQTGKTTIELDTLLKLR